MCSSNVKSSLQRPNGKGANGNHGYRQRNTWGRVYISLDVPEKYSIPIPYCRDESKWYTAVIFTSVTEEDIIKVNRNIQNPPGVMGMH